MFIQNNLKVGEKKFQFRYITKKKSLNLANVMTPLPASRVFSFFAQRYLHNIRLVRHVITTMATTKTQTGLPTRIVSGRFYVIMNSTMAKKMQEQAIWRPQQFVPHGNENIKVSATLRVPLSTFFYGIPCICGGKKFP